MGVIQWSGPLEMFGWTMATKEGRKEWWWFQDNEETVMRQYLATGSPQHNDLIGDKKCRYRHTVHEPSYRPWTMNHETRAPVSKFEYSFNLGILPYHSIVWTIRIGIRIKLVGSMLVDIIICRILPVSFRLVAGWTGEQVWPPLTTTVADTRLHGFVSSLFCLCSN